MGLLPAGWASRVHPFRREDERIVRRAINLTTRRLVRFFPAARFFLYRVPAGVFLTVGVVGSNEVLMVYALLLIGAGAVFHQVRRRPGRGLWVVCFCTAALCSIVVLLAPGNSLRLGLFPDGRDIPHTVGRCLLMPWVLFARWSINPALLGLTVLALPLLSKWGRRAAYRPRRRDG